jgi:hypothetical protein
MFDDDDSGRVDKTEFMKVRDSFAGACHSP